MNCTKCNQPLEEGAVFCPNCGQPSEQASPIAAPQTALNSDNRPKRKKEKKPTEIYVEARNLNIANNIMLVWVILAAIILVIAIHSGSNKIPVFLQVFSGIGFLMLPAIVTGLLWVQFVRYHKAKKVNTGYCPKCKAITPHNSFAVCTECKVDYFSNCIPRAVLATIAYIIDMVTIACADMDFYKLLLLICAAQYLLILIFPAFSFIYMYPSRMAKKTGHAAAGAIFWLNIFLGATVIFWIVLLIWASSGRGNLESKINAMQAAQPVQPMPPVQQNSVSEQFAELQKLKEMGALTDDEFEQKRQQLLQRI